MKPPKSTRPSSFSICLLNIASLQESATVAWTRKWGSPWLSAVIAEINPADCIHCSRSSWSSCSSGSPNEGPSYQSTRGINHQGFDPPPRPSSHQFCTFVPNSKLGQARKPKCLIDQEETELHMLSHFEISVLSSVQRLLFVDNTTTQILVNTYLLKRNANTSVRDAFTCSFSSVGADTHKWVNAVRNSSTPSPVVLDKANIIQILSCQTSYLLALLCERDASLRCWNQRLDTNQAPQTAAGRVTQRV